MLHEIKFTYVGLLMTVLITTQVTKTYIIELHDYLKYSSSSKRNQYFGKNWNFLFFYKIRRWKKKKHYSVDKFLGFGTGAFIFFLGFGSGFSSSSSSLFFRWTKWSFKSEISFCEICWCFDGCRFGAEIELEIFFHQ